MHILFLLFKQFFSLVKLSENKLRGNHDPVSWLEKGGVAKSGSIPSFSSEASESEDTQDDAQAVVQPLLDTRTTQHYENSAFQTADVSPAASNDTFSACGDSVMEVRYSVVFFLMDRLIENSIFLASFT